MGDRKKTPTYVQFITGGISGVAASLLVHPLDLLKNRMQLSGVGSEKRKSIRGTIIRVYKSEGIGGFYQGVTAGMFRQATYGSARLGTFLWLMNTYKEQYNKPPDFYIKAVLGMTCGMVGATIGTPAEVALVRMTADGLAKPENRRNYPNALSAIATIVREEGITSLWRGVGPTVSRAMVANAAELSSYSQSKQVLITTFSFADDVRTHLICSFIAAFVNVSCSLPLDIAKTRIQNRKEAQGRGPLGVISRVIKYEGVTALWKGFIPCFACIGPRTILIFIFVEYLNKQYRIIMLKEKQHDSGL